MGEVIDFGSLKPNHFVSYEPRQQGGTETWGCVDERYMKMREYRRVAIGYDTHRAAKINLQYANTYLQLQGGAIGFADARAVATESQQRGNYVQYGNKISVTAGIMAKELEQSYDLVRHGSTTIDRCGREAYASEAKALVISKDPLVFAKAQVIYPPLDSNTFEKIAESTQQIVGANFIETDTEADRLLTRGGTVHQGMRYVPAVRKIGLVQSPHVSALFGINHGRSAYDSRAAWEDPHAEPEYHLSFGRLPELHAEANEHFKPVSEELFLGAVAVDAAATSMILEKHTGVDFTFHVYNA